MKEQNNENKKKRISGEKKFYLFTAIGCAAVLVAIIAVALAVSGGEVSGARKPGLNSSSAIESVLPGDSGADDSSGGTGDQGDNGNKPVAGLPEGMILPVAAATVGNDYGFYHNQTLNSYYVHAGVDFMAAAGTEVLAVDDGVVESIYKDDILLGTEIVVAHANGVKSTYRFVTEAEDLRVGDEVKKGQVIATVAEATGNEYKDGAHLHFEITENGTQVDPTEYLTLEEK